MNGRKAKVLRRLAVARATKPSNPGYIEREVPYNSVDRHGKPVRKMKRTIQFCYHQQSWRSTYRRLKRAYARSRTLREQFFGL